MLRALIEGRTPAAEDQGSLVIIASDLHELTTSTTHDEAIITKALAEALPHSSFTGGERQTNLDESETAAHEKICNWITYVLTSCASASSASQSAQTQVSALQALNNLSELQLSPLDPSTTLVAVTAYTNPTHGEGATDEISQLARKILERELPASDGQDDGKGPQSDFIVEVILKKYLRPIFSRTSSSRITSSGRKAFFEETARGAAVAEVSADEETKPWKSTQKRAVTVFAWAVSHSNGDLIRANWPMYTPVLLALLDDSETEYRARGLEITNVFLRHCPGPVLRDTGLGDVLSQSLLPTLNFLPSLTPERESVQLLNELYPVLLQLAQTQYDREQDVSGKRAFLGKVLRDGVFTGYWHASQFIRVTEVLLRQSAAIVDELGLAATPYLKDLIPMYCEVLSDPFITRAPTCLTTASQALSATMRNCWPRIAVDSHLGEILKALTMCWLTLQDESSSDQLGPLRSELISTANILSAILAASDGPDLQEKTAPLCAEEPSLTSLFAATKA